MNGEGPRSPERREVQEREAVRIACQVPIAYARIDAARAKALAENLEHHSSIANLPALHAIDRAVREQGADREDAFGAALLGKLLEIEEKVDRILHALEPGADAVKLTGRGQAVDLSAAGVRMMCASDLAVGELLELELRFDTTPPVRLRVVGRVCRMVAGVGVGVAFHAIHEEDREWLYQWLFARQRELLRKRSAEAG